MPKKEVPLDHLQHYLPPGTAPAVMKFLQQYKVHLTIARERKSILGDYRHRTHVNTHRISVNGNLNVYSFLITLVHELAHLLTFEQFGNKVLAHGKEWKSVYSQLINQFLGNETFPPDVEIELKRSMLNPAASSCAEDDLIRVLKRHDPPDGAYKFVKEFPANALFQLEDGRIFRKGEKIRKRFKCTEVKSGKIFLFSPVYEVMAIHS